LKIKKLSHLEHLTKSSPAINMQKMKKVIIIGSSIAGASASCLLAGHCDVTVYEQKSKFEVGKKSCANVVTPTFLKYAAKLGLNPKRFVVDRFEKAYGFSEKNYVLFRTREFKIDREKLIPELIEKAQKKGAKFVFNAEFVDFEKKEGKFIVKLRKNRKDFFDACDILVGADGALSSVAKKAGLWKNRRHLLVMQTEIPFKNLKKIKIHKRSYRIYFSKNAGYTGYYAYIFPYKNKVVIGTGNRIEKCRENYNNFLKFLGVKGGKIQAALVPEPKVIPWKDDLFLIGDAGCQIKFSGGGIVPAMIAAFAMKDAILHKDFAKMRTLNRRTFMNHLAARVVESLNDKEFDSLIEVLKKEKFSDVVIRRDELDRKDYFKLFDRLLLKFLLKII